MSNSIQTPLNDVVKRSLGAVVAADVHLVGGEVLLDQSSSTANPCRSKPALACRPMPDIEGIAKAPLPAWIVACTLAAVTAFAVVADLVKVPAFRRLGILGPCLLPKG